MDVAQTFPAPAGLDDAHAAALYIGYQTTWFALHRRAAIQPGEHLLVYQTSTTNTQLPEILKQSGLPCHIYGLRRDLTEDVRDGNLLYRPFSEKGFIDEVIMPHSTRRRIAIGLRKLRTKTLENPWKKHDNIPL